MTCIYIHIYIERERGIIESDFSQHGVAPHHSNLLPVQASASSCLPLTSDEV